MVQPEVSSQIVSQHVGPVPLREPDMTDPALSHYPVSSALKRYLGRVPIAAFWANLQPFSDTSSVRSQCETVVSRRHEQCLARSVHCQDLDHHSGLKREG